MVLMVKAAVCKTLPQPTTDNIAVDVAFLMNYSYYMYILHVYVCTSTKMHVNWLGEGRIYMYITTVTVVERYM